MEEQWKAIPQYEGFYEISNQGIVRSVARKVSYIRKLLPRTYKSKILKPCMCGSYHPHVLLAKDGEHKMIRVDRLYAKVWSSTYKPDDEEWRPVPDFEDLYEVSQSGRVRSLPRTISRSRTRDGCLIEDIATYTSRELKPAYYHKRSRTLVYHFHRRYKPGRHGQTDVYWSIEDLLMLVFPEN